jgi:serine phosphatase RsbU (regulator of sigma subunit)
LAAALMIYNVQSSLRTAISFAKEDVARVVEAVNRQVHASSLADRYATLFYGVFDPFTRALRYVSAVFAAHRSRVWIASVSN